MDQPDQQIDKTLQDFFNYLAFINYDMSGIEPMYSNEGKLFFNDKAISAQYEIFKFVYKIGFIAGRECIKEKLREIAK